MSYRVELRPTADREYARLAPDARAAVLTLLHDLGIEPRRRGVAAVRGRPGVLRLTRRYLLIDAAIEIDLTANLFAEAVHNRWLFRERWPDSREIGLNTALSGRGTEWVAEAMAERGGFEPPSPVSRTNGFRDRRIQPLCHLSARLVQGAAWCHRVRRALPGEGSGGEGGIRTLEAGNPAHAISSRAP